MSDKFNLILVQDHFEKSLTEEDDVNIKHYLESYEELNKFFLSMGKIFGFVSSDLKAKMNILEDLVLKDEENFVSAKKMILYERENALLNKKGYVSGSRTLLRLHRGLDFIRLFLKRVSELNDGDNTSDVCRSAYDETLAHFHSFLIVKGARIAMYALPTKEELFKRVCGDDVEHINAALESLPKTLDTIATVYVRIEDLYTVYDLHKLP